MNGKKRILNSRCVMYNCLDDISGQAITEDIMRGMTAPRKFVPSKYFYDMTGSRLFGEICTLPEYYLTRTEISILDAIGPGFIGPSARMDLVEMGPGSEEKISRLIRASTRPQGEGIRYIPVDVSESAIVNAGRCITSQFSLIRVMGFVADFTRHLRHLPATENKIFILFGSTIGNYTTVEMRMLLQEVAGAMNPQDRFLLGLDMVKDPAIIEAAYNDSRGVTAAFNKNILHVLNREVSADFAVEAFDHLAFFNPDLEQVEMHLVANRPVTVNFGAIPLTIDVESGESILTEISRKFRRGSMEEIFASCGLEAQSWHTDTRGWFSLVDLVRVPC